MENTNAAKGNTMATVASKGDGIIEKLETFKCEVIEYTDANEVETVITDISLRDIARAFEISFSAMRRGLKRRGLRGEIIRETYFITQTLAFAEISVTKMLVWQVELACALACDIKNASNRKSGRVCVRKVVLA